MLNGTQGLSPPTRGSPVPDDVVAYRGRSIPAHAGEPSEYLRTLRVDKVYPRPRGGAYPYADPEPQGYGLSPPTRGSPPGPPQRTGHRRSIPAHAGEPCRRQARCTRHKVYPRPRGGAAEQKLALVHHEGLSPPTRGSHQSLVFYIGSVRSIPAHAGEPLAAPAHPTRPAVYPRPRGGARSSAKRSNWAEGLSPPTRGSRRVRDTTGIAERSIPAHAGEPWKRPVPPY